VTIYKDNALIYLQHGFSVIPDKQGDKKPAIAGWPEFSNRMPTFEEVQTWCQMPKTNIAVMLGKSSGIIALDLDTDNTEILAQINHILPASPVERRGSKGWCRFFRYNGESTQLLKDSAGNVIMELLSHGKKVTIPPSIHPKGMEYKWIGKNLIEIDRSELPLFPANLFNLLAEKLKLSAPLNLTSYDNISQGRHSALSSYCSELIRNQISLEVSVSQLLEKDIKNSPESPYFSDLSEQKCNIPLVNAAKFYVSHLESINIRRFKEGLNPEIPLLETLPILNQSSPEIVNQDIFSKTINLPEPSGLIKELMNLIISRSYVEQPVFALSASLVLLGTLIGRKMIFDNATPNLYMLNVAYSGSGKDSCQSTLKSILKAINASSLIGAASYPSEASIIAFLGQQPTRLDIVDEASSFLRSASSGGAAYQTGIGDMLCELYSCANDFFLGKVLGSNGGSRVGECYRPHLNIS
jgi:hypothetical protein